jgi:hypothetical protein
LNDIYIDKNISSLGWLGYTFRRSFIGDFCFVFEGGLISGGGSPFIKDCGFISRFR